MKYNGGRVPIHLQNNDLSKAVAKKNPSYESFRENVIHKPQYSDMGSDRPSTHGMSRIRRYVNGELDYNWAMLLVVDAIHKAENGMYLTPLEESMLTVIFPVRFNKIEPAQAEINTQLSRTEKNYLKDLVTAHLKEELNWNAGRGGGSVDGRKRTLTE